MMAAVSGVMMSLVGHANNSGPNGTPTAIRGSRYARLYQKISCTSGGTARKTATNTMLAHRRGANSVS